MAIAPFTKNMGVDNSKLNYQSDRFFFIIVVGLILLISGCGRNRLNQCEQIFRIASEVNSSSQEISLRDPEKAGEMKSWLETASMMNIAADKIQALHINNVELIEYQNKLSKIYRIYAQATYDAVVARENKNREALESARNDAVAAGVMQQNLVRGLNNYCLNR